MILLESKKKIAVVGAGPAGLEAATVAAKRGQVVLFEEKVKWQFNMAKVILVKKNMPKLFAITIACSKNMVLRSI